jgi:hypothetical protein
MNMLYSYDFGTLSHHVRKANLCTQGRGMHEQTFSRGVGCNIFSPFRYFLMHNMYSCKLHVQRAKSNRRDKKQDSLKYIWHLQYFFLFVWNLWKWFTNVLLVVGLCIPEKSEIKFVYSLLNYDWIYLRLLNFLQLCIFFLHRRQWVFLFGHIFLRQKRWLHKQCWIIYLSVSKWL